MASDGACTARHASSSAATRLSLTAGVCCGSRVNRNLRPGRENTALSVRGQGRMCEYNKVLSQNKNGSIESAVF